MERQDFKYQKLKDSRAASASKRPPAAAEPASTSAPGASKTADSASKQSAASSDTASSGSQTNLLQQHPAAAKTEQPTAAIVVEEPPPKEPPPQPPPPPPPPPIPVVRIEETGSLKSTTGSLTSLRNPAVAATSSTAVPDVESTPTLDRSEAEVAKPTAAAASAATAEVVSKSGGSSSGASRILLFAKRGEWANVESLLRKGDFQPGDVSEADEVSGETPLMMACKDNKLVIVDRLLENGASVSDKSSDGRTPLHFASQFAKDDVIKLLLSRKADPSQPGGVKNQTPLHYACQRTQAALPAVQLLLKATRNGRLLPDKVDNIPLFYAVEQGNAVVVKELLDRDTEAQVKWKKSFNGETALHIAASRKDMEAIKILCDAGAEVNVQNNDGLTPLHISAHEGDETAIKFFHTCKADASLLDKFDRSPLHMAAERGQTRVVELLIDKFKCNVLARTKDGSTLMHVTSQFGYPDTTLAFLRRGVPLHMPNKGGGVCLHAAAKSGHASVVRGLLDKGANVNARTKDKLTALHAAVACGHPHVVETLLGFGASVDFKGGEDEDTPLHLAARTRGGERCAEMLLKSGADVNRTNRLGQTPLHTAAKGGNLNMLRALLDEGGDPTRVCQQGNSPLHMAARHCRQAVAAAIIEHVTQTKSRHDAVNLVNLGNKEGETALHYAAELTKEKARTDFEDTDLVKLLLRYEGDVSVQTKYTNETPLHYCARSGNEDILLEIVKFLDHKIQLVVNKQTTNGWSPLLIASDCGRDGIVDILLRKHARVDVFDTKGFAALHLAAKNNNANVVRALLRMNAFVNAKSKECYTPLHLAAQEGHNEVVLILLKQDGVEVDARTLHSKTPLHLAAQRGHKEVCETLVDHSADCKATDNNGQTPLHLAAEHDRSHVVKMFLRKKDIVTLASAKGMTCAHIAASKGSISVINELLRSNRNLLCTGKIKTNGCTALHLAAQEGHERVVKLLVEAGASPSDENIDGMTPLHLAAQNGHSKVLQALKEKVDLRIASRKSGLTPLHIAAHAGKQDFVQEILNKVPANLASIKPKDYNLFKEMVSDYGFTPLHLASQSGHESLVRYLLNSTSVKVDSATIKHGMIPLHLAAQNGETNVASLLLSRDTNQIRLADSHGRTALHWAANKGHYDMTALLVGQGADVNGRDHSNWAPLHFAAKMGHLRVMQLLVDSKANCEAETKDGKLPVAYAAENNHVEVVSFLLKERHNTYALMEDWKFLYNIMLCSKISGNKTLEEFILVSPAPAETAAKLSKKFVILSEREKERAKELVQMGKYCENMCTELVAVAAAESGGDGAAKLLKAVDNRGVQFLDILLETEQKEVIAHPAVQRYLTDVWRGNLDWPTWKFLLLFTVFLAIPPVMMAFSLPLSCNRYHRKPVIKFIAYLIAHVHLIFLFVFVAVEPEWLGPPYYTRRDLMPTWLECLLLLWLSGQLVSELTNPADRSGLGIFKVIVIAVAAVGVITHLAAFALPSDTNARLDALFARNQLFAFATLLCFVMFLEFLTFHHLFGPWSIIIRDLMRDLMRFLVILAIFMAGFTVHLRSLYVPVYRPDTYDTPVAMGKSLLTAFELLFFALFGYIEPDNLPNMTQSPTWTMTLVKVIFGCYLIITLIVLINLLIAMMSDTYERIRAESDTEWKFGRAKLISNINKTSSTPTPMILVTQLIFVLRNFRRKHRVQSQSGLEEDDVDTSRGDVMHSRGAVNRNAQSSGQENATEHRGGPAKIEDVVDWESVIKKFSSIHGGDSAAAAAASEALELTPEPKARQRRRGSVLADGDRESRRGSRIFED
ncbi:hypothetical protein BOX15_Mlig025367g1 [Macrostomum lignano]|uniref:Ion transport domain-containing protein n=2 Tax=Macrostomum lignano TaxID=282301 RepID=A0A267DZS7_9PLAT|nr:hypothetical protein BOX15_Mlig025367g1 [Macrostomum lignano]